MVLDIAVRTWNSNRFIEFNLNITNLYLILVIDTYESFS